MTSSWFFIRQVINNINTKLTCVLPSSLLLSRSEFKVQFMIRWPVHFTTPDHDSRKTAWKLWVIAFANTKTDDSNFKIFSYKPSSVRNKDEMHTKWKLSFSFLYSEIVGKIKCRILLLKIRTKYFVYERRFIHFGI